MTIKLQSYICLIKICLTIPMPDDEEYTRACSSTLLNDIERDAFVRGDCFRSSVYSESHQTTYEWSGDFDPTSDMIMDSESMSECIHKHITSLFKDYLPADIEYLAGYAVCDNFKEFK